MRVVGLGGDEPAEGSADVVVAIDGPAGSGKSTVARRVAERARLRYLDTGATYRALTLLRGGGPVDDPEAVADAAKAVDLTLELPPGPAGAARSAAGRDRPGPALRAPRSTPRCRRWRPSRVRELLVGLQRSLVGVGGIVVEGRDIGTVVWPDADVKVFLTASQDERARRRGGDASGGGETAETLAHRDAIDSGRAASPTRPPTPSSSTPPPAPSTRWWTSSSSSSKRPEPPARDDRRTRPPGQGRAGGEDPERGYRIAAAVVKPLMRTWFLIRLEGHEHVPKEGPVILASNHRSNMDPVLLASAVKRPLSFMAKAELFVGPLGWIMRWIGQFPVRRGGIDREALRRVDAVLARGSMLGLFPEGTRGEGASPSTPAWPISWSGSAARSCR